MNMPPPFSFFWHHPKTGYREALRDQKERLPGYRNSFGA